LGTKSKSNRFLLIKFVPITEEQATEIYKRHRSYTR